MVEYSSHNPKIKGSNPPIGPKDRKRHKYVHLIYNNYYLNYYKKVINYRVRSSSTVVEPLPHNLKVEGLIPAAAAGNGKLDSKKKFISGHLLPML